MLQNPSLLLSEISYSKLALLDKSPTLFYKKYILQEYIPEESEALTLGSAVDCLLTQPDEFYNLFSVTTKSSPTGQLENFVKKLIELKELTKESFEEAYRYTQECNGGKVRDSIEKFIENFELKAKEYYLEKINSQGKQILTFEQFLQAQQIVTILKTNRFTSQFLADFIGENIDRYYQVDKTFEYQDLGFKVKLDVIIVNHNKQTIQPLDIKTTSDSPYGFTKSMYRFRYDLQAVIYSHYIYESFIKEHNLENYQVLPFKFIVVNSQYPTNPLIWKMSHHDMIIAKMGKSGGSKVKGFWDLIDDLKWHISTDLWDYKREIYESNGEVESKMYGESFEEEK